MLLLKLKQKQHGHAQQTQPLCSINLLRAPCAYPRGKTTGYYGSENKKRRATLTSKTQSIMLPVTSHGELQVNMPDIGTSFVFLKLTQPSYFVIKHNKMII